MNILLDHSHVHDCCQEEEDGDDDPEPAKESGVREGRCLEKVTTLYKYTYIDGWKGQLRVEMKEKRA